MYDWLLKIQQEIHSIYNTDYTCKNYNSNIDAHNTHYFNT
jgi:hypothetical protein